MRLRNIGGVKYFNMTKFDLNSFMDTTKKEYGLGKGEYLKLKEGDNKIRDRKSVV